MTQMNLLNLITRPGDKRARCSSCPELTPSKTGQCDACRTLTCPCGTKFKVKYAVSAQMRLQRRTECYECARYTAKKRSRYAVA